jgi:hypothetical protein
VRFKLEAKERNWFNAMALAAQTYFNPCM